MVRSTKLSRKKRTPQPVDASVDESVIDSASPAVVEGPDDQGDAPFESYELARPVPDAVGVEALAPGETSREAVREIGVDDWIATETGGPADDGSPSLLQEE